MNTGQAGWSGAAVCELLASPAVPAPFHGQVGSRALPLLLQLVPVFPLWITATAL